MYKILLPVTTSARLVRNKLDDLKGYEDKLVVVNNWTDKQATKQVKELAARGAEAWDCSYNLGLAATWNFGMKRMMDDGCDFLIILAPSAVFDKSIQYFVDAILEKEEERKRCRYVCSGTATLHCFAQTRYSVEVGGYFDENFWPIYYEDTDYCHRSKSNGVGITQRVDSRNRMNTNTKDLVSNTINLGMNDVVSSHSYSISCNSSAEIMRLHQMNSARWSRYYVDKWGGQQGSEQWQNPFNNPNLSINDWEIQGPFWHSRMPHPWNPPAPSVRY